MKSTYSKKLISLLLSLLMVVTSIPMTAITANAAISASYQKHLLYGSSAGEMTITGATWNSTNEAWDFSAGKYASIDIHNLFENTNKTQGFTISFRGKANSTTNSQGRFFTFTQKNGYKAQVWDRNSSGNSYFDFRENGDFELASSRSGTASQNKYISSNIGSLVNAEHIYTLTVQENIVKVYVDGTHKTTNTNSGCDYDAFFTNMKASTAKLLIGGGLWQTDSEFNGYVGQVNIYNKALSAEEVATDMNDIKKDYNSYNEKVTGFSGKLEKKATGVPISGSESRWNTSGHSNQMNIVNDQQPNNTDAGIIKYDISALKGMNVESATLNYKVDSWSADTATTGLVFYYSTSINNESTYVNNGEKQGAGWSCGSGTTANNSFATGLGFSTSNTLGVVSKGSATSTTQMDIKTALQKALDAGATKFFVIIMQSTAGGSGSNNGWSDTWLTPANFTIDYSVKVKERTRAEVVAVKSNLTDTKLNNAPYQGNMSNTEDGSYTKNELSGGDAMSSVLYSYGVGGNSTFVQRDDDDYWLAGIQFGQVTLLYDGEHEMGFPINFFIKRTQGGWPLYTSYSRQPVSVYVDSSYVEFKHNWHGLKSDGAGYVSSTSYGLNIVNEKSASNPGGYDMPANEQDYYSNTLYIKPNSLTFNNNLAEIAGVKFNFYVNQTNKNETKTGNTTTKTDGTQSIRVINYKPVYDAIKKGKEIYNTVSANEYAYCPTDLYNFYNALDKLCSFNPNNYFAKDNNGYQACLDALNALDSYIDVAKTTPTTSDWSYTHSYTDGQTNSAVKHSMVCSKCGEEVEENCTWNAGVETTPATCTATGLKTYTCTKCNGTYVETIPMAEHNWGAWNGTFSSTKHTRQCQDCKKWDEYVECDHNTVIPGKAATCTETGLTDGYACSVCGVTRVAQTTIPTNDNHTWDAGTHVEKTHIRAGFTHYVCSTNANHTKDEDDADTSLADVSAYNSAVATANAIIAQPEKYSASTITALTEALEANALDDVNGNTQAEIDAKVFAIESVEITLKSLTVNVIYLNDAGDEIAREKQKTVEYGTEIPLTIKDKYRAVKWIRADNAGDIKVAETSQSINATITSDTTYYVTVNDISASDNASDVAVKLLNRNNKLVDAVYVPAGEYAVDVTNNTLSIGTDYKLVAPSIVFYDFEEFRINGKLVENGTITIDSETVVTAVYAPSNVNIDIICDESCSCPVEKAYWDQKITVTAVNGTANTKWYANNAVVGYGPTYTFRASADVVIRCENEQTATPVATVLDLGYGSIREKTISAVCSYYLPSGYKFKEAGVLLKTSAVNDNDAVRNEANYNLVSGNAKKFVATNYVTDTNQYVINVSSSKAYDSLYMGAVAFVTVTDEDGNNEQTFYSPLQTENYTKA